MMRLFFPLALAGMACTSMSMPVQAEMAGPAPGLVQLESSFSVAETADRLESLLQERGLTRFNRIDHAENAAAVNQELPPTELIIFGNPNAGTALMQCNRTVGIDLPLKAMIWEDATGQVWFTYNDPAYLMERHGLEECAEVLGNISTALENLANAATTEDL